MRKEVKIALYSIPVLIGAYLIYRQLRKPKPTPAPKNTTTPPNPPPPNTATSTCNYPLKKGMYNCDKVESLQYALNNIPMASRYAMSIGYEGVNDNHEPLKNGVPDYTDYNFIVGCVKECASRPLVEDGDFGDKTEKLLLDTFGKKTIDNQAEMDTIWTWVVSDIERQEIENPYVFSN